MKTWSDAETETAAAAACLICNIIAKVCQFDLGLLREAGPFSRYGALLIAFLRSCERARTTSFRFIAREPKMLPISFCGSLRIIGFALDPRLHLFRTPDTRALHRTSLMDARARFDRFILTPLVFSPQLTNAFPIRVRLPASFALKTNGFSDGER